MVNVSQINTNTNTNTNSIKLSASSIQQSSKRASPKEDTKTINDIINTHENMISSSSSTGSNNGEYVESNNIIAARTTTANVLINKKKSHLNGQKSNTNTNTNGISSSITSSSSNYSSNASSPSSSQISFAINQLVISNSIGEESQPLKPIKTNGISFHYELNSLNLQSYTSHNNSMSYKTLLRVKKVLVKLNMKSRL